MSYIRCLSNPEGLYIVGTGKNVEFWQEDKHRFMPSKVFNKLLDKYVAGEAEEGSAAPDVKFIHEGAVLEMRVINKRLSHLPGGFEIGDWKWFLSFSPLSNGDPWKDGVEWDAPIEMWEVTLDFIAQYAYEKQRAGFLIKELKEKGFEEAAKVLEERYEDTDL